MVIADKVIMEQESDVVEKGSVFEEFKEADEAKRIIGSLPDIVGDKVAVERATDRFICESATRDTL